MDRSRRVKSDEQRGTAAALQELAAERERRAAAAAARAAAAAAAAAAEGEEDDADIGLAAAMPLPDSDDEAGASADHNRTVVGRSAPGGSTSGASGGRLSQRAPAASGSAQAAPVREVIEIEDSDNEEEEEIEDEEEEEEEVEVGRSSGGVAAGRGARAVAAVTIISTDEEDEEDWQPRPAAPAPAVDRGQQRQVPPPASPRRVPASKPPVPLRRLVRTGDLGGASSGAADPWRITPEEERADADALAGVLSGMAIAGGGGGGYGSGSAARGSGGGGGGMPAGRQLTTDGAITSSGSWGATSIASWGGRQKPQPPQQQQPSQGAAGSSMDSEDLNDAEPLELEGGFMLPGRVAGRLYAHQVEGVKWLWSLHTARKGGILADDMGLGKTMQCSAFLAGTLGAGVAKRALIVAPKTLLAHWEKELITCGLRSRTNRFYGSSEGERTAALRTLTSRRGGVLLTTYGMVLHNAEALARGLGRIADDEEVVTDEEGVRLLPWDYLILDEGHKIKNPSMQLAQRLRTLGARVRLIISGTPIQNNLSEMWALFDFAVPGLLGPLRAFKINFEKPILMGQDRDAFARQREAGAAKAAELRRVIAPYLLRREKSQVLPGGGDEPAAGSSAGGGAAAGSSTAGGAEGTGGGGGGQQQQQQTHALATGGGGGGGGERPRPQRMGRKTDLVVWLRLAPLQRHVYEAFLNSDAVRAALNSTSSPLAALTVLKKICDHPALLSKHAASLVVSAGTKWASKGFDNDSETERDGTRAAARRRRGGKSGSSSGKGGGRGADRFVVDDDDDWAPQRYSDEEDESVTRVTPGDSSSSGDEGSGKKKKTATAVGYSEEWCSWAGQGSAVEKMLVSDLEQRGTEASCKTAFVCALLDELVGRGHRVLVFSQSRVMLDILQAAVELRRLPFCRIDGTVTTAEARQAEVERFQAKGATIPVFLLTSQVGGLGLTLTAADRVIIVDPSWNPAQDNQSVDRVYRIGQSRDVIVYRLVTCGTVEEKIYRKQVFKGGLSRTGIQEGVQLRYFTHHELHELFKITPEGLETSETQQLLQRLDSNGGNGPATTTGSASGSAGPVVAAGAASAVLPLPMGCDESLRPHLDWIDSHPSCAGTSDHQALFKEQDPEGDRLEQAGARAAKRDEAMGFILGAGGAAGGGGGGVYGGGSRPRTFGGRGPRIGGGGRALGGGGGGGGGAGDDSAWQGASYLSDLMSGLGLGDRGNGAPGAPSGPAAEVAAKQQRIAALQRRAEELAEEAAAAAANAGSLGKSLPDGGAKLLARQRALEAELESTLKELGELQGNSNTQGPSVSTTTATTSSGSQNGASVAAGRPSGGGGGAAVLPRPPVSQQPPPQQGQQGLRGKLPLVPSAPAAAAPLQGKPPVPGPQQQQQQQQQQQPPRAPLVAPAVPPPPLPKPTVPWVPPVESHALIDITNDSRDGSCSLDESAAAAAAAASGARSGAAAGAVSGGGPAASGGGASSGTLPSGGVAGRTEQSGGGGKQGQGDHASSSKRESSESKGDASSSKQESKSKDRHDHHRHGHGESSSSSSSAAVAAARTVDGATPTLPELKARKRVLKDELMRLERTVKDLEAAAAAARSDLGIGLEGGSGGSGGVREDLKRKKAAQVRLYREYKEVKRLLAAAAEGGGGAA